MGRANQAGDAPTRRRVRPLLLVLVLVCSLTVFLIVDLFWNVEEFDAVRRRADFYKSAQDPPIRVADEPGLDGAGGSVSTAVGHWPFLAITGRVEDEEGNPIPNAFIHAVDVDDLFLGWIGVHRELLRDTKTRRDGTFELRISAARRGVQLEGYATGYAWNNWELGEWPAVRDPVLLVLSRRVGQVRGRVRDKETLDPIAGADLVVSFEGYSYGPWTADSDGRFAIDHLPQGAIRIGTAPTGYAPAIVDVVISATTVETDILVERGLTLRGVLRDADTGTPIPGATLRASCWPGRARETDDLGRYEFEGYPVTAGRLRGYVRAIAPGYVGVARELQYDPPNDVRVLKLDLSLQRAAILKGLIVDDEGKPVPRALVTVQLGSRSRIASHSEEPTPPPVLTLENGRFAADHIAPGHDAFIWAVRVEAPGHYTSETEKVSVSRSGEIDVGRIELHRRNGVLIPVRGSVETASGERVKALIQAWFRVEGAKAEVGTPVWSKDGSFELEVLEGMDITLTTTRSGYRTVDTTIQASTEGALHDVRVVLTRASPKSARAVPVEITTDGPLPLSLLSRSPGQDWRFSAPIRLSPMTRKLKPGRYELVAIGPSFVSAVRKIDVLPGEPQGCVLEPGNHGMIRRFGLVDERGRPLRGALVRVVDPVTRVLYGEVRADASGTATVVGLPSLEGWRLGVEVESAGRRGVFRFDTSDSRALRLFDRRALTIRVVGPEEHPVAGAVATLRDAWGRIVHPERSAVAGDPPDISRVGVEDTTGADGVVRYVDLPSGPLHVTVEHPLHRRETRVLDDDTLRGLTISFRD